jgi:hypothetical protein
MDTVSIPARARSRNGARLPTLITVQGSLGHPAGHYARVVEAVRADLESSGTPAFVTAVVTPTWDIRVGPVVFAAIGPCRAQAQTLAARLGPGEMVLVVARRVEGERQTFTVHAPDALSTIYRKQELADDTRGGRRVAV